MRSSATVLTLILLCGACPVLAQEDRLEYPIPSGSAGYESPSPHTASVLEEHGSRFWDHLNLRNIAYMYNNESVADTQVWDVTQIELTYFANLFEPTLSYSLGEVAHLRFGAGLYFTFDQETRFHTVFPIFQTRFHVGSIQWIFGSLENDHRLPSPILHPLVETEPRIRAREDGEGTRFSHGRYEYGAQMRVNTELLWADVYINWQLLDTTLHKERFDLGASVFFRPGGVPLYFAGHYWHNGGRENPHAVPTTENYNFAFGFRDEFSVLYFVSWDVPNRSDDSTQTLGQALYLDYRIEFATVGDGTISLRPLLWITDEWINSAHRYISQEGDLYFNMPLYVGFDVRGAFPIVKGLSFELGMVNGVFFPTINGNIRKTLKARFDQLVKVDFSYDF